MKIARQPVYICSFGVLAIRSVLICFSKFFLSLRKFYFEMHKINRLSRCILTLFLSVYFLAACKKETKTYTPVPFLTGRIWIADTITINPPTTYAQLSNADQTSYRNALSWFKAHLTFNEDATVTCGGDYDPGYKTWRLINNNADIEVLTGNGTKYILRNWVADAAYLSYTEQLNNSFDCTLIYK